MTFEWLPVAFPWVLSVGADSGLGIPARTMSVTRTPDLHLRVVSEINAPPDPKLFDCILGTFRVGTRLRLSTAARDPAVMQDYHHESYRSQSDPRDVCHTVIEGSASCVSVSIQKDAKTASVTEWLTNLPDDLLWPRNTSRRESVNRERSRHSKHVEHETVSEREARDHARLELGNPLLQSVTVGVVSPKLGGHDVTRPGFVEFEAGKAGLPDEYLRRTSRHALEFLFGGGLGVVGRSEFDAEGQLNSYAVTSAYVAGGGKGALRPALLHSAYLNGLDEDIAAKFVRSYIQHERVYDLNNAVWQYLHAQNAPLTMKAGYVGVAFEILRRRYYEDPKNKQRSRLLPRALWRKVRGDVLRTLSDLSAREQDPQLSAALPTLVNKSQQMNEISGTKLNKMFLDDLQLAHSKFEESALAARNDSAHGNPLDSRNVDQAVRNYRALHTLFARALLKVLGTDLQYIDYSSIGFPARALETRQGPDQDVAGDP